MADTFTVTAEVQALLDRLDALLGGSYASAKQGARALLPYLRAASKETAERIADGARARVPRRTGRVAASIGVQPDTTVSGLKGEGFLVGAFLEPQVRISGHTSRKTGRFHTQRVTQDNLPIWLEFGTVKMTPRPFLFVAARLEEDPHRRRMEEALQAGLDGVGD